MTRFLRTFALFCCLSTTAIAGTLTTTTVNLNGTPLNVSAGPAQKTLVYTAGLPSDSFQIAYSFDDVNYIQVPNCPATGANWTCVLTYPAQYIAAINASSLTGALRVVWVFSNGVTSVSPTNQAINLPASGGAGTALDTTSLAGLTSILTIAYSNGNPGAPYYPSTPTDQVAIEGSPEGTNWAALQGANGTPCYITGAKSIVQCYAGPRYLRARYVYGQGQWPAGCSGSCNQATMTLQMGEAQLTSAAASTLLCNGSPCVTLENGVTSNEFTIATTNGSLGPITVLSQGQYASAGRSLGLAGANGANQTAANGNNGGGLFLVSGGGGNATGGFNPGSAGLISIQPSTPGTGGTGNASGALVTIDAAAGAGTGASTNNNIALASQAGQTTEISLGVTTVGAQGINYVAAGGANNAITVTLVDGTGANITLAAGLELRANLNTHTLQAGANTLALNGGATKAIKSHLNVANNIATAYPGTSIVALIYDGTEWQDESQ